MLTWAIIYGIKNGIELPGIVLVFSMIGDVGMVVAIAAALGGAWR